MREWVFEREESSVYCICHLGKDSLVLWLWKRECENFHWLLVYMTMLDSGGKKPLQVKTLSHFFFFRSSHKGTYRWLTCYEKQEHTFQAMTWKTLEQYFAGKCDIWDSPKMGVEWDGFSEETQKWSTFNKQLGPWHMRGHFLW